MVAFWVVLGQWRWVEGDPGVTPAPPWARLLMFGLPTLLGGETEAGRQPRALTGLVPPQHPPARAGLAASSWFFQLPSPCRTSIQHLVGPVWWERLWWVWLGTRQWVGEVVPASPRSHRWPLGGPVFKKNIYFILFYLSRICTCLLFSY